MDGYFDPNAKPLRRDGQFRITTDGDGNPVIEFKSGESITLSPDGSIDRAVIVSDRFYHCGHTAEGVMGGQCSEGNCKNISCEKCFTRCAHCQKPLCLEHVHRLAMDSGTLDLCHRCKEAHLRSQRRRALLHALINPFVQLNSKTKS